MHVEYIMGGYLLMEHCQTLKEYSMFVAILRDNLKIYDIDEAVECTVNYCIEESILVEFLRKNKAEVISRMIYVCNYEEEMKKIGDDRYEDGFHDGLEQGREQGIEQGMFITVSELYSEGIISEEVAAQKLQITLEEFREKYTNTRK